MSFVLRSTNNTIKNMPARTPHGEGRVAARGSCARWLAAAAAGALLAGTAALAFREAWAEQLFASGEPEAMRRAAQLVPHRAQYLLGLAELAEREGDDPIPFLRQAAASSPADAAIRIHLGLREELAGRMAEAEAQLVEAARLSRKYLPRWTLANFYFRQGRPEPFWRWTRQALEVSYGDRTPLFELAWRLRPDPGFLLERAIPMQRAVRSDFSWFLLDRGELEAASRLLADLAETAEPGERERLLAATDRLIEAGAEWAAAEVWNGLCRRGLLPYRPLVPRAGLEITNGDFAVWTTGWGFDWRISGVEGVYVTPARAAVWRIHLSGKQPERCELLRQMLVVGAGKRYRIECRYRAEFKGLAGDAPTGLRWRIRARDGGLLAESAWLRAGGEREVFEFQPERAGVAVLALEFERLPGAVRPEGFLELRAVQAIPPDRSSE